MSMILASLALLQATPDPAIAARVERVLARRR